LELINEPKDAATTDVLNPIYAEAIRQIRQISPDRTIFVGPGQFNTINQLGALRLPDTDENLIVTVHSYDPFLFTHQGASWTMPDTATTNLVFPGPPQTPVVPAPGIGSWATNWLNDYNTQPTEANPCSPNTFRGRLHVARQWSDYYGRPVHVGEFGCYRDYAPPESRVRFYTEMRQRMEELGLGWAMWDWKAGFRYWQEIGNGGQPDPLALREAMFPHPRLTATGVGSFETDSAIGKTFLVQKSVLPGPIANWQNIATQQLLSPHFRYTDPQAVTTSNGFYRLEWMK
jgi:endoglucanase